MNVERLFTKQNEDVYESVNWKRINIDIKNYETGEPIFKADNLEFPEQFSQNACEIIAKMYFRKTGVPITGHEISYRQLVHRLVKFWMDALIEEHLLNDTNKDIFYDELAYGLLHQMWAPNSPQWFNTGIGDQYGIVSNSEELYYYDGKEVKVASNNYERTQGSACFILNVNDSLFGNQSLTENLSTASKLFRFGSGVGSNWSKVRGKGEPLTTGGSSSGVMSFLKVFDTNAGVIKSGGATRRSAVMNILDIDHPNIKEFITWKATEEKKVYDLKKMGYPITLNGGAYETVSGQNVNNSILVTDEFMDALKADENVYLHKRVSDGVVEVRASDLWNLIAESAWYCGDPGLQFKGIINAYNTCKNDGDIVASNPCSEYLFLDDTACNLASINIAKFYDFDKKEFDIKGYIHFIHLIQMALEATVFKGLFPTKEIAINTYNYRTTGLGLSNLGGLLMGMGIPYNSEEGCNIGAMLASLLTCESYRISSSMAVEIGAFPRYDYNRTHMLNVISAHKTSSNDIKSCLGITSEFIRNAWDEVFSEGKSHGFRNAQVTVMAPTGTIGFAMDCDSTSIEPIFSHIIYKKVTDGSVIKMINRMVPIGLKSLGYSANIIDELSSQMLNGTNTDEMIHIKESDLEVFKTATTYPLSPEEHVNMVASITPHISGGISKTINMPNSATVDDVSKIFLYAYEKGCKCITIYRDGSKAIQPMGGTATDDKSYDELLAEINELRSNNKPIRKKLSAQPPCLKNTVNMDGATYHIIRSFYDDGQLGEIFCSTAKQGNTVKGLIEVLCIIISKALQYGIPVNEIAKILRGHDFSPRGFVFGHPNIKNASSIPDLLSKFIDISINDYSHCQIKKAECPEYKDLRENTSTEDTEIVFGESCPECGSYKMVKSGTCKYCSNCGASGGCS